VKKVGREASPFSAGEQKNWIFVMNTFKNKKGGAMQRERGQAGKGGEKGISTR